MFEVSDEQVIAHFMQEGANMLEYELHSYQLLFGITQASKVAFMNVTLSLFHGGNAESGKEMMVLIKDLLNYWTRFIREVKHKLDEYGEAVSSWKDGFMFLLIS